MDYGYRAYRKWANTEFASVLFLLQLVALIPLSAYLPDLDFKVAWTYILIPLGFVAYSRITMERVRGVTVRDVLLHGCLAFLVTTVVALYLFVFVLDMKLGTVTKPAVASLIVTQVLFVAPGEELAFRFIIPNWLSKKMGARSKFIWPALISSALFALFHFSAYAGSWPNLVLAFIVGLIWAVMYHKWGLGATMGSHAAYNLVVSGLWLSTLGGF